MEGMNTYMITVESETPPQILLGQNVGGAVVVKLEKGKIELVTAAQLSAKYNLSVTTIREKLLLINQGSEGKHLYNPSLAHELLTKREKKRPGPRRAN